MMCSEPLLHGGAFPIGKHLDNLVALEIFFLVFVKRQISLLMLASEVGCHSSVLNSHSMLGWASTLFFLTTLVVRVPLFVKRSETAPEKPDARPVVSPNEQ